MTTAVVVITAPMAKHASSASGATPRWSGLLVPSAATIPATCVPWPDPRSVLEYGVSPIGIGSTGLVPALAYSGLSSTTLWTMRSARSGWVPSQPESITPTVTPLPVSPLLLSFLAAAGEEDMTSEEAVSA